MLEWMDKDGLVSILQYIVQLAEKIPESAPQKKEVNLYIDRVKISLDDKQNASKNSMSEGLFDAGIKAYREKKYDIAFENFSRAAEDGNKYAQMNLGVMYERGEYVTRDLPKALFWFQKAADQGVETAQEYVDDLRIQIHREKAEAAFRSALNAYQAGNLASAFQQLLMPAEAGHVTSQFILGNMYDFGESVPVDNEKAFYWYKKAADHGHTDALYNVGQLYLEGRGTSRDLEKAYEYFFMAAKKGSRDAYQMAEQLRTHLAHKYHEKAFEAYDNGDAERTVYAFTKSGEYGNDIAWLNLGIMYLKGELVGKNPEQAKMFLEKAAQAGNTQAMQMLNQFFHS